MQKTALKIEIDRLLAVGFIYQVEYTEWALPVVIVPKKNGKLRVCVDYKPLNATTKRNYYPLSFQDEMLRYQALPLMYILGDYHLCHYLVLDKLVAYLDSHICLDWVHT